MKKILATAFCAAVLAAGLQNANANVYASELSVAESTPGSFDISFILNEDATAGVTVNVLDAGSAVVDTINAGNLTKGAQTVTWDGSSAASGTYTFEVVAAATGYGDWTSLNDSALTTWEFFSPRALEVNKNQASPYFGRIYVGELGGACASGNRTTSGEGFFILHADQTAATSQGDAAIGTSRPRRLQVDADDNLWASDWSDAASGLYIMDQSDQSIDTLFSLATRDAAGILTASDGTTILGGSCSGMVVEGSGSAKVVTTWDEDVLYNDGVDDFNQMLSYAVGTATTAYETAPTAVFQNPDGYLLGGADIGIVADGAGGYFAAQYRWSDGTVNPALVHFDSSWAIDWISGDYFATDTLGPSYGGGVDISPDGNTILQSGYGFLSLIDISGGDLTALTDANVSFIGSGAGYSGNSTRDVAYDAAGNVYATNSSSEALLIFSPGGANSFTISSPAGAEMVIGTNVRDWSMY